MSEKSGADWDSAATDARVEELLAQLTLDEKVAFVTGDLNWDFGFYADGVERLGIPNIQMADGPAGVRINKGDVHEGRATSLPAPIALAATWDPAQAAAYGSVIGAECRASDHNVSLGPAVDIARVPVGGRTFESFGEDPLLQSAIGVAVVRGIQEQGVQACAKHYAINNQEDHRSSVDAVIDERTMRELYLPPFEALVREGGVASMMGSFNRVNGAFACENPQLLHDILRRDFGFRGWIMSDYGANHSTAEAANAGLDQEQPNEGFWGGQLLSAVHEGRVSEAVIDEKVRNILRPMIGLGQRENPVGVADLAVEEHHAVAQAIAEDGMVLLRNDGILPLTGVRRVALIGPDVDAWSAQGGGSSQVKPTRGVSPADGLRRALGDDVEVVVEYGVDPVTPGALLPGADPIGSGFFRTPSGEVGLHAEYWANPSFDGDPLVSRVDGKIELLHGFHNFPGFNASSARYEKLPTELNAQMSARYTGTLTVPVTGSYRFVITSLGSCTFELDGRVVVRSGADAAAEASVPAEAAAIDLAKGSAVDGDGSAAVDGGSAVSDEPRPYGWGGDGGQPDVAIDEVVVRLQAGRTYALRLSYAADHPSQGFLIGAKLRLGWVPPAGVVAPDVTRAATAAASADVAVVVVRSYEAEADDRPGMQLPSGQDDLIRAVLAANPRTVVVLMTGAPVDVTGWGAEPAALLQAWYPGQAQGDALARVLTGAAEPGGRLPLTLPVELAQTPARDARTYPGVDGRVHYDEGVFVGYRAFDAHDLEPAYPFGHGLGYTTWELEDLVVAPAEGDDAGIATVTVRNTGARPGACVVQVYAGDVTAPVPMPPQQLAGFAKVRLDPGRSERVSVRIPRRVVSYFDVVAHDWRPAAGPAEIRVGVSSRDIRLSAPLALSATALAL
ncbi:Beta-glucosidase [Microbacterium sp. 8M]|uniref:glycoside hydrolase family 3 protein n=1 Tax=Microbacterium sp. 8M TaxID=2653153 RepID=UPI0012EEE5B3|nr:glycoside hydrolase family 3 C-terminal domain-containing protein [Microbacterium sp. 8M]VXB78842.1 Beta-glucosidase [Microbacterium sp. 8M]